MQGGVSTTQAQAYGATSFSAAVLSGIFNLYYVEVYDHIYGLNEKWFHAGQLLFAVWNALNDPLFGYLNDRASGMRLKALRFGGRAWAVAFMLPWIPILVKPRSFAEDGTIILEDHSGYQETVTGLHFLFTICFFDTCYTYVMIVHAALLADITTNADDRDKLNQWRQYGSIAGSTLVFGSFLMYDQSHMTAFILYCILMSVLAAIGFQYTATGLLKAFAAPQHVRYGRGAKNSESPLLFASVKTDEEQAVPLIGGGSAASTTVWGNTDDAGKSKKNAYEIDTLRTSCCPNKILWLSWKQELNVMIQYMSQVMKMPNFRLFVGVNFLQYFQQFFNSNFFPFFERTVFGEESTHSSYWRAVTAFSVMVLPPLCVLGLSQVRHKYAVIQSLNAGKVVVSILALTVFGGSPISIGFFMVVVNVMNGASFGFFDLVVADLVDEDLVIHNRVRPLATMMHGTQSMMVKPAQSLAPMVGMLLLRKLDHSDYVEDASSIGYVWFLIVAVPACCSLIQTILWSRYSLHGSYLASIKQRRLTNELSGEFSPY